jgi:hypothetical protein
MEGWLLFRQFWSFLALILLLCTLIILIKARGIFSWKKSLKKELNNLQQKATEATGPTKDAIYIIVNRCKEILSSFSPDVSQLQYFPQFIQSIAACYHPQSDHPELQITISALLKSCDKSLGRFDQILQRRGFKRLRIVNIRRIENARQWYLRLSASQVYKWYFRHYNKIRGIAQFRLFLFYDPFMWLAYLSNRLTLLLLVKYLMVDLYLYFGKLASAAFAVGEEDDQEAIEAQEDLEKTLEELESLEDMQHRQLDPEIQEIRNRLMGFTAILTSNPTFTDWKNAVYNAAMVISIKYFPESDTPLQEAALGPLLERSRSWIVKLSKGEDYLLARHLYQVRLGTLYRAKNFSDLILPNALKIILQKTYATYGWIRWPLKVYRWVKKRSPWMIALDLGWFAAKKASIAYIVGNTFDRVCEELEIVYHQSRTLRNRNK